MSEETAVPEITDESFDNECGEGYCLVDFYATWCPHCKSFRPKFEQAAADYDGPVTFLAANVEDAGDKAKSFGIRSIPSLVLLNEGELVDSHVGGMEPAELQQWLADNTSG
jgi:thioredoxin